MNRTATPRPRTGPIVWGALILAGCAWVALRTMLPESADPVLWVSGVVLGLGLLLLIVGAAVLARGRSEEPAPPPQEAGDDTGPSGTGTP